MRLLALAVVVAAAAAVVPGTTPYFNPEDAVDYRAELTRARAAYAAHLLHSARRWRSALHGSKGGADADSRLATTWADYNDVPILDDASRQREAAALNAALSRAADGRIDVEGGSIPADEVLLRLQSWRCVASVCALRYRGALRRRRVLMAGLVACAARLRTLVLTPPPHALCPTSPLQLPAGGLVAQRAPRRRSWRLQRPPA